MNEFDDPFDLHRQSKPSGRFDHEGHEIRLLGQPILARKPAMNNLALPDDYRHHPLVAHRYFYTLPSELIDAVVDFLGEDRFEEDSLALERRLSAIIGDHTLNVGIRDGVPIPYRELRPLPIQEFAKEIVGLADLKPAKVDHGLRVYEERDLPLLEKFSKAYCGWLMTNQSFLDEHDTLLSRHAETINRWGTQHPATNLPASYRANLLPGSDPYEDPLWPKYVEDFRPFLTRWRLSYLAGPYLPVPAKPLMAGIIPLSVVEQLMEAGGLFFLPDTMPIPSRDKLRSMLDDAIHRRENVDHLMEWLGIVRTDNAAKNRMDPFVRYFELQHYWRIFHRRHASAIYRKSGKLEEALKSVFKLSRQQIRLDMMEIRKRLGSDWLDRPCPLENSEETLRPKSRPR